MTISTRYQEAGALAVPGGSFLGYGGTVRRAVVRVADTMLGWADRARQRRLLASLDRRMLDDIGITPADVLRESDKPFWRG